MSDQAVIQRIHDIENQLALIPPGTVVYKTIRGKKQPYLQWREQGKTKSKYIKMDGREKAIEKATLRKNLTAELEQLKSSFPNAEALLQAPRYRMNVKYGDRLYEQAKELAKLERRDCYLKVQKFLQLQLIGRVGLLYGLRRTGKTTLLFQTIADLPEEERSRAVYIKAKNTDTMADLDADLDELSKRGYRYVFIDEVTLLHDFIDTASMISDVYAMMGMKIILSGTDSLGFWFSLTQELYDRAFTIHTTYIPFYEYSRLMKIQDVDEYIRYGGTLKPLELAFDDPDALDEDAAFRDDESTRRYIDTAICKNIQRSLQYCERGNYFRHLRTLYEAGELTGAINRIIESMNHQFLLSTLMGQFKSHDLGSAAEMLRKQPDPAKRTRILDKIDREAVTQHLMQLLDIRRQEEMQTGITEAHVKEIKEYLKALDLVVDCPRRNLVASPEEYVLFTQPGMRYCQAQALVYALVKDPEFGACSEIERKLACDKILDDVRGRMLEDIVLLDTSRSLPKHRKAFKLILSRSEFDMVIYDSIENTCEAYEVKHSDVIVPRQYHVLSDEEQCEQVMQQYGKITRKCIIYKGKSCMLDNGIEYINAEEYLTSLSDKP
ncbi:MAG: AAA family ATPase [Clostridia bacterium]|nr:AAA family ATPase [Clostridia bacterium]